MQGSDWCATPLALLTSGQAARFTYRTAFALVRGKSGRTSLQQLLSDKGKGRASCTPPAVDAFIVLSLGKATVWTGPNANSSSSVASRAAASQLAEGQAELDVRAVHQYYSRLGVRTVRLKLYTTQEMHEAARRIDAAVAASGAAAVAATAAHWWHAATSIPQGNR